IPEYRRKKFQNPNPPQTICFPRDFPLFHAISRFRTCPSNIGAIFPPRSSPGPTAAPVAENVRSLPSPKQKSGILLDMLGRSNFYRGKNRVLFEDIPPCAIRRRGLFQEKNVRYI
ncbi:MAG: hypothetical protein J6J65_10235, partial [Opitutales bacterium]|nr:hypothetical protein [Opitutales bacterium]